MPLDRQTPACQYDGMIFSFTQRNSQQQDRQTAALMRRDVWVKAAVQSA